MLHHLPPRRGFTSSSSDVLMASHFSEVSSIRVSTHLLPLGGFSFLFAREANNNRGRSDMILNQSNALKVSINIEF